MPIIVQCKKTVLYVMPNGCVVLQYASFTFLLHRQIGSHFGGEKTITVHDNLIIYFSLEVLWLIYSLKEACHL